MNNCIVEYLKGKTIILADNDYKLFMKKYTTVYNNIKCFTKFYNNYEFFI